MPVAATPQHHGAIWKEGTGMGEATRRRKMRPLTPGDAIFVAIKVSREKGHGTAAITAAIALALVGEAMLRAEEQGATWKTARDFETAGDLLESLCDEVKRLGLQNLDLIDKP